MHIQRALLKPFYHKVSRSKLHNLIVFLQRPNAIHVTRPYGLPMQTSTNSMHLEVTLSIK